MKAVAAGFGMLTSLYSEFMTAVGASERVFDLLERKPLVDWKGGRILEQVTGQLVMENVYFSYPSRADIEVLKGINLTLSPGQVVALVGKSGGGKSETYFFVLQSQK